MDANTIFQGLVAGCIYTLAGVSINMMYRPTNTFNFAQGDLIMIGAIACAMLVTMAGLPWVAGVFFAIALVTALAGMIELVAVTPLLRRAGHGAGWIISTLAVSLMLHDGLGKLVGADPINLLPPRPLSNALMQWHGLRFNSYQLAVIAATILLVIANELFYRSRLGKAMLAVAEDRDACRLLAINPVRLGRAAYLFGGALAAATGILAAPILYASVALGPPLLIKGFEIAAVGGIGSNRGAIVAGLAIGIVEAVTATILSPGYQEAVVLAFVLGILLARPFGLFGAAHARDI